MIRQVEVREVRVKDSERFAELVEDQGYSYRTLSEELRRELRKTRRSTLGTSKSTLGNLATGEQTTVRRDVAVALTTVLGLKKWSRLFADDLYTVQRETGHTEAA